MNPFRKGYAFLRVVVKFTEKKIIPEINIGLVGHVDHGKTSLTQALTGKWTDTHSEELKRGITIRLGYADATFYYCNNCKRYGTTPKCSACFEECKPKRAVSFVDAPGHETLMATLLSGTALMEGALLVIAANERCPQPQTAEHLKALDIAGIKNIVIAQNKIDIVSEEEARKNYEEIKQFVKGTVAENAPIIPISSIHNANIDALVEAIETTIKTPERDLTKDPRFYIAWSFDVNKPGTAIEKLQGGVLGGSLTQGTLRVNDEIEIKPGIKLNDKWHPLEGKIVEMIESGVKLDEAKPGGLIAVRTELDPSLTKGSGLTGSIASTKGKLPETLHNLDLEVTLFDYVIGISGNQSVEKIKKNDKLMITAAIAKTVGVVTSSKKSKIQVALGLPVCAEKSSKVAISKQVGGRWHLIGWGKIL